MMTASNSTGVVTSYDRLKPANNITTPKNAPGSILPSSSRSEFRQLAYVQAVVGGGRHVARRNPLASAEAEVARLTVQLRK